MAVIAVRAETATRKRRLRSSIGAARAAGWKSGGFRVRAGGCFIDPQDRVRARSRRRRWKKILKQRAGQFLVKRPCDSGAYNFAVHVLICGTNTKFSRI